MNLWRTAISYSLILLVLSGCAPYVLPVAASPAHYCGMEDQIEAPTTNGTTLTVWAAGDRARCWRAYAPAKAAQNFPEITVDIRAFNSSMTAFISTISNTIATEPTHTPDIAWVNINAVRQLKAQNAIIPLTDCKNKHTIFAQLRNELWQITPNDVTPWGIPTDNTFIVLFYSKPLLAELGWSAEKINNLPADIANGQFTVSDMLETAEKAVDEGVVLPGMGFNHHPEWRDSVPILLYASYGGDITRFNPNDFEINEDALRQTYITLEMLRSKQLSIKNTGDLNFWTNRLLLNDAQARGRVLFWVTSHDRWRYWASDHAIDAPADQQVANSIGTALFPAGEADQGGLTIMGYPHYYVIFSEAVTGRKNQALACDLLAETLKPEFIGRHHLYDMSLSPLESAEYPTEQDPLAAQQLMSLEYMWPYAQRDWYDPDPISSPLTQHLFITYAELVDKGQLTPAEAVAQALTELQDALGPNLTIRHDQE